MEQKSRLNEIALEEHKKHIEDQGEASSGLSTSLEDLVQNLMKRDKNIEKEWNLMEKRLN